MSSRLPRFSRLMAGEIPQDDYLLIRLFPGQWAGEAGRPFTNSFRLRNEPGLSAYLASECAPAQVLAGHVGFGLVRLPVLFIRTLQIPIVRAPDSEDRIGSRGAAHVELQPEPSVKSRKAQIPDRVRDEIAESCARGGGRLLVVPAPRPHVDTFLRHALDAASEEDVIRNALAEGIWKGICATCAGYPTHGGCQACGATGVSSLLGA